MKPFLILLLVTIVAAFLVLYFSSSKSINRNDGLILTSKKSHGETQSLEVNNSFLQDKRLLKDSQIDAKGSSKEKAVSVPDKETVNNVSDIDLDDRISKKQQMVRDEILELDNDLQNPELKERLQKQLADASEYKKDMLIKAKKEMKNQ